MAGTGKMQKDLRIGMVLGLVLVAIAAIWLSTRQSLSVRTRMQQSHDTPAGQESTEQPRFVTDLPSTLSTAVPQKQTKIGTEQNDVLDFTAHYTSGKIKTTRFHIVRKDETLSGISRKYYGSAHKWKKIRDANRKIIKDVNNLKPGTKLTIPE